MRTLGWSLAAILSVALSSAIFAASDEYVVTGTVVKIEGGTIVIDEGKHDGQGRFEVVWDTLAGSVQTPKVGEKVRVHWYRCGGRGGRFHCADKLEKLDNTGGGSKKK
jgi:hypothetical protein